MTGQRPRPRAFSLIELIIVVAIIGVLAAIAIPRMSLASKSALDARVKADLGALRTAIEFYAAEHGGGFPTPPFWQTLTRMTNAEGDRGSTPTVHIFGPYLKNEVPIAVGPNAGATKIEFSASSPPTIDESKTDMGWAYNQNTGEIIPNTDDLDASGVPYNTY